jgi:hypothetical protein
MPGRKLPHSPLRPDAPNYANARGKQADKANAGIEKEANPGKSPASVPDYKDLVDIKASPTKSGAEYHDGNYAQYMNRGSGRYEELVEHQSEGSFDPHRDHRGKTSRIHRQKSAKP